MAVERRSIKTLLSQGIAGGACGTFLCSLLLVTVYSSEEGFVWVILFPFSFLVGMVMGAAGGFVIWITQKLIDQNLSLPSRIVISILFTILLSVLFKPTADSPLDYRFIFHILFATPIGMLAGSRSRPWRLIARGINDGSITRVLFKKGPIRINQPIEELGVTGMPLRAASLFALMVSLLLAAYNASFLWRYQASFKTLENLIEDLLTTAYFGLTVAVSFAVRAKWDVLILAVLVNVPWATWMLTTDEPNPNAFVLLLVSIFIISWLLFVTGVALFPVKGELHVEYGHTEIRFGKQQWVKESQ